MTEKRSINYRVIILHIIGCIAFLSIPILSGRHSRRWFDDRMYINEIMEYTFTIVFFYLNYYYLIPHLYLRRKYALFVVMAIGGFLIVSLLPELLTSNFNKLPPPPFGPPGAFGPPMPPNAPNRHNSMLQYLWMELGPFDDNFPKYAAVFILAMTLRITEQLKKIQKEKAESELMFLKAQINPHFLFNTLNSVYTLAIEAQAGTAAKAIAQLSGMMRYAISEATIQFVPLSKEISYVDNYVTLQRLRLNERVNLSYVAEGDFAQSKIAPFLLIPFIENAFKYGVSTDQDSAISILIKVEDKLLTLHAVNDKVKIAFAAAGTSLGIKNTRSRLDLLYPGKYRLVINDTGKLYEVLLNIEL